MSYQVLADIVQVIRDRDEAQPSGSYVVRLLNDPKGIDKILEKVGEESVEFIIAIKNGEKERVIEESADLLFHLLVALHKCGISMDEVMEELAARRK